MFRGTPYLRIIASLSLLLFAAGCRSARDSQAILIKCDPIPWTLQAVGPDNVPVAGAKVYFAERGEKLRFIENIYGDIIHEPLPVGVTDVNGKLDTYLPGQGATIVVRHARGYRALTMDFKTTKSRIELRPYGRIEGVMRRGNQPYANAIVEAASDIGLSTNPNPGGVYYELHTRSDSDGHYAFNRVPAGGYEVSSPFSLATLQSVWIMDGRGYAVVSPDETTQLYLGGVGRQVEGRVHAFLPVRWVAIGMLRAWPSQVMTPKPFDQDFTPQTLQYFWITKEQRESQRRHSFIADATGKFHIDDVLPGEYVLEIDCYGSIYDANQLQNPIAHSIKRVTVPSPGTGQVAWEALQLQDVYAARLLPPSPGRTPTSPAPELSSVAEPR